MDLEQIALLLRTLSPQERAELLNANALTGFDAALGIRLTSVSEDEVVAQLTTSETHTQPYGLVHGGVYASLAESVCSVGAAMAVMAHGKNAVGSKNTTHFLRATRPGAVLTATARPKEALDDGRRLVWEAVITDESGARCALGRVTVVALPAHRELAGEVVGLREEKGEG